MSGQRRKTTSFQKAGFTFIELIFALVAASILSMVLVQLIGGNFVRSAEQIQSLDSGYELRAIMENITAHYKAQLLNAANPLVTLHTDISAGNNPASNHYFGDYASTLKYLRFTGGLEAESECSPAERCNLLKVTIEHNGQSLTALFSK